jgi:protein STE50
MSKSIKIYPWTLTTTSRSVRFSYLQSGSCANFLVAAEQSIQNETATKEDIQRWARSIIKLRDERMEQAEEQLRQLAQEYRKLRQELIPVFKMAKERLEPLPNVPGYHVSTNGPEPHSLETTSPPVVQPPPEKTGLSRTLSLNKKKLFLGSGPKNHSPTHIPSTIHEGKALLDPSSVDPSAAATAASHNLTPSMSYSALPPTNSPSAIPQPSPTSPLPHLPPMLANRYYRDGGVNASGGRNMQESTDEARSSRPAPTSTPPNARDAPNSAISLNSNLTSRNASNNTFSTASTVVQSAHNSMNGPSSATQMPGSASGGGPASTDAPSVEIFKSFRVGLEDPCHKVLPAALRKYNIQADWRQYALYIVYGDQERCVDLDEKPLALFKALDSEGKKPMFMLRKLAPSIDTPSSAGMRPPGLGVGGVPMSSGASVRTLGNLPGGQL